MEIKRYRLTAIGSNTPDMLSNVTQTLSLHNYEIESISSLRLGHSIVLICIIKAIDDDEAIRNCLQTAVLSYDMTLLIDKHTGGDYKFVKSDAFLRVKGNHEAGIKAYIISELIGSGLDIHGLASESNVIDEDSPEFVMTIKGGASQGMDILSQCTDKFQKQNIEMAIATDFNLLV